MSGIVDNNTNLSPSPHKEKVMIAGGTPFVSPKSLISTMVLDFVQAIKSIKDGYKVTKLEWGNAEYFGQLHDGHVQIHKPDGTYYDWIINDGDLFGEDWVVCE